MSGQPRSISTESIQWDKSAVLPQNHRRSRSISGITGHSSQSLAPEGKDIIHLSRAPTFNFDRRSRCVRASPLPGAIKLPKHAATISVIPRRTHEVKEADLESQSPRHANTEPIGESPVGQRDHDFGLDESNPKTDDRKYPYLVIGIFNRVDGRPQEMLLTLKDENRLFYTIFWAIVKLRGFTGLFSLKDVKQFSIFTCDPDSGAHRRMRLDQDSEDVLHQFFVAYNSWETWTDILRPSKRVSPRSNSSMSPKQQEAIANEKEKETRAKDLNTKWTLWLHDALNNKSFNPARRYPIDDSALSPTPVHGYQNGNGNSHSHSHSHSNTKEPKSPREHHRRTEPHTHYSLEVVLGWSPRRIGLVVFTPVLISLVVGLVLNSRDWSSVEVVEMSWVVGTYVATTGGIIAALMAVVSEIQKPGTRVT